MQDDTLDRVDGPMPGRALDHPPCVSVAGLAAEADAGGAEVDVLAMVFVVERRRQQPDDMHPCEAAIAFEVGKQIIVALVLWNQAMQTNNAAQ